MKGEKATSVSPTANGGESDCLKLGRLISALHSNAVGDEIKNQYN